MIYTISEQYDIARDELAPTLWPGALMLTGNARAHLWSVALYQSGLPIDLTGATAVAKFLRESDGVTVVQVAQINGNVVSVQLALDCYRYPGQLTAMMEISSGSGDSAVVTTAKVTLFRVLQGASDVLSDPENIVPSIGQLYALIGDMEQALDDSTLATDRASDAADDAEVMATRAEEAADALEGITASAVEVPSHGDAYAALTMIDGHYHLTVGAKTGHAGQDAVIGDLATGLFALYVDDAGDLICEYTGDAPPPLEVDANGDLVWTYEEA